MCIRDRDIDGFAISGYGDVGYTDLMNHNAYAIKGTYSPCYSTLKASQKNTIIKKAKNTGYLIYNTIEDACTCDAVSYTHLSVDGRLL